MLSGNWLHLLGPLQRDAIANKVYRSLTDTTGKIVQNNIPIRLTTSDPSTLDMVARTMPSLSTRQIINAIGDKIVNIFFFVSQKFLRLGFFVFDRFRYLNDRVFERINPVQLHWLYWIERSNRKKRAIAIFDLIHSKILFIFESGRWIFFLRRLVQRWQECYSGCDLSNLFTNRQDIKELLKNHPIPEVCE